jgi:predicted DNA binding CopG/RHH family protein
MQQPAASASTPASASFATLLAALSRSAQRPAPVWNDEELADDVATLSYESALKAHTRYRSTDQSLTAARGPEPFCFEEASSAASQPPAQPSKNPASAKTPDQESLRLRAASFDRNPKEASVTIRMSKAECAQLRLRAAEAGLSVSAYLRSCTFEAESLRAMVKETLRELRTAASQTSLVNTAPPRPSAINRLARLFTPRHGNGASARLDGASSPAQR